MGERARSAEAGSEEMREENLNNLVSLRKLKFWLGASSFVSIFMASKFD